MNFAIPAPPVYGSPYNQQALLYAQNFQDLGFDIQIDQREATEHYATTFNGSGNDGGASMTRSVQVIEPDEGLKNMYNGDSPRSPIIHGEEMFADTRLSDLLEAQTTETDLAARTEIIFDLQRHIAEKAYLLPDIAEVGWWYTSPDARNFNGPSRPSRRTRPGPTSGSPPSGKLAAPCVAGESWSNDVPVGGYPPTGAVLTTSIRRRTCRSGQQCQRGLLWMATQRTVPPLTHPAPSSAPAACEIDRTSLAASLAISALDRHVALLSTAHSQMDSERESPCQRRPQSSYCCGSQSPGGLGE